MLFYRLGWSEFVCKYNGIWQCIYLIYALLIFIVLQPHNFHLPYSKLNIRICNQYIAFL
jgi:hypothetical protein